MKIFVIISFFYFIFPCQLEILEILGDKHSAHNASLSRLSGQTFKKFDWCSLVCKSTTDTHIACVRGGECSAPDPPCKFVSLNKNKIVRAHNKLRNRFASGEEPQTNGILVADMMALKWDDDLAFLAACNLKTCPKQMIHDQCHITTKFDMAGQNIAWSQGYDNCATQSYDFVKQWYEEVKDLTKKEIKSMRDKYYLKPRTGHFTQVIWSQCTHVGCAMTMKDTVDGTECMLTCNYAPGGNILGGLMFKSGKPTSSCPKGVEANNEFRGLCGGSAKKKSKELEINYYEYEYYNDSSERDTSTLLLLLIFPTALHVINFKKNYLL